MDGSDGKTKEFVALLTRYSGRIYSFIRTLVPNHIDAEDLFQEVSATLWEKFGTYRSGSDFRAWAFQIARFKVLNFRKTRAHQPQLFDDELVQKLANDHLLMDAELDDSFHALADCYQKLSAEDRELLDLRYLEAASVPSMAEQTGRSVDFVYKALRRIYGWLYRCIDEEVHGDDPP
jgi:RNA polymerase sigma-70 factor, ECF subfamily